MAEDHNLLQSKHKAITVLLLYAVLQEEDGWPGMLVTILHAARASKMQWFMWHHIGQFVGTLFSHASPGTIVLVSPHIHWVWLTDGESLVQQWVAAASAVTYTEEVTQNVVDTLLQIASENKLAPYISTDLWSQLNRQPSLPAVCLGHYFGAHPHIIKEVQALEDIDILKSYLLLVWSEWSLNWLNDHDMSALVQESFGGIEMGHHRGDLIQRLDDVLGQLDNGLEYLKQHSPEFSEDDLERGKNQYQTLRETLLRMNL